MKRIVSFLSVICLLLCMAVPAFADTAEPTDPEFMEPSSPEETMPDEMPLSPIEEFMQQAQEAALKESVPAALKVQYDPADGHIYLYAEAGGLTRYLLTHQDELKEKVPDARLQINLITNLKFNDGPWLEDFQKEGKYANGITNYHEIDTSTGNTSLVFHITDLNQYDAEKDTDGFMTSVVTAGDVPYIDFTEHTLYVRSYFAVQLVTETTTYEMQESIDGTVEYHNNKNDVEVTLQSPTILNAIWNTIDKKLLFTLEDMAEAHAAYEFGHDIQLVIMYRLNIEDPSEEIVIPFNPKSSTYIIHIPAIAKQLNENSDLLEIRIAFRDKTQKVTTDGTSAFPTFLHKSGFEGFAPDDVIDIDMSCAICHDCTRPLGICIWFLVGAGIFAVCGVTFIVIFTIKTIKSKKEKKHA